MTKALQPEQRLDSLAAAIKGSLFKVMANGGDELAIAKATIEHISGCLCAEIEDNEKLRLLNADMLSALRGAMVIIETCGWPDDVSDGIRAAFDKRRATITAAIAKAEAL